MGGLSKPKTKRNDVKTNDVKTLDAGWAEAAANGASMCFRWTVCAVGELKKFPNTTNLHLMWLNRWRVAFLLSTNLF
jgi:hypothetical protein